ncbi:hypothetical protein ACJA23_02320 [Mycoplasma corogypsi]|uniref:cell envelope integrity protein TolA n=1 Tax=Mycoplasma corogypsi TaxID=2106 RepID=UPI003873295D
MKLKRTLLLVSSALTASVPLTVVACQDPTQTNSQTQPKAETEEEKRARLAREAEAEKARMEAERKANEDNARASLSTLISAKTDEVAKYSKFEAEKTKLEEAYTEAEGLLAKENQSLEELQAALTKVQKALEAAIHAKQELDARQQKVVTKALQLRDLFIKTSSFTNSFYNDELINDYLSLDSITADSSQEEFDAAEAKIDAQITKYNEHKELFEKYYELIALRNWVSEIVNIIEVYAKNASGKFDLLTSNSVIKAVVGPLFITDRKNAQLFDEFNTEFKKFGTANYGFMSEPRDKRVPNTVAKIQEGIDGVKALVEKYFYDKTKLLLPIYQVIATYYKEELDKNLWLTQDSYKDYKDKLTETLALVNIEKFIAETSSSNSNTPASNSNESSAAAPMQPGTAIATNTAAEPANANNSENTASVSDETVNSIKALMAKMPEVYFIKFSLNPFFRWKLIFNNYTNITINASGQPTKYWEPLKFNEETASPTDKKTLINTPSTVVYLKENLKPLPFLFTNEKTKAAYDAFANAFSEKILNVDPSKGTIFKYTATNNDNPLAGRISGYSVDPTKLKNDDRFTIGHANKLAAAFYFAALYNLTDQAMLDTLIGPEVPNNVAGIRQITPIPNGIFFYNYIKKLDSDTRPANRSSVDI